MAVETPLEHESGVFVRYHRILEVRFNFNTKVVEFYVQGFVDELAAKAGKMSLGTEIVRIPLASFADDPRKWMYEILTSLPSSPFIDARADTVVPVVQSELRVPTLTDDVKTRPLLPPMPLAPEPEK